MYFAPLTVLLKSIESRKKKKVKTRTWAVKKKQRKNAYSELFIYLHDISRKNTEGIDHTYLYHIQAVLNWLSITIGLRVRAVQNNGKVCQQATIQKKLLASVLQIDFNNEHVRMRSKGGSFFADCEINMHKLVSFCVVTEATLKMTM